MSRLLLDKVIGLAGVDKLAIDTNAHAQHAGDCLRLSRPWCVVGR